MAAAGNNLPWVPKAPTVTISSTGTVSSAFDMASGNGFTLCGLQLPSTFDGTVLSFQVSAGGTTYVALENGTGSTYTRTVSGASKAISLEPQLFAGWRYVKVVSSTTQADTDTIIELAVRRIT